MLRMSVPAGLLALAVGSLAAGPVAADALDEIEERGRLIVGVKVDYRPYGFRDPGGDIVGIEPDLAMEVADELGVELELVPVVSSNRMQFLEQGRIDLMIATMTDTPERREAVQVVEPNYYSSGTNVLARKEVGFEEWQDLDGKPICGIQGAFYNRRTATEYGAEIVAFTGTAEALTALEQGRCIGFVYDDAFIISKLTEEQWAQDYEMSLPSIDDAPWGIAVAKGEERFDEIMGEMIENWHASGRILELEEEYGVENTAFAQKMHEQYEGS